MSLGQGKLFVTDEVEEKSASWQVGAAQIPADNWVHPSSDLFTPGKLHLSALQVTCLPAI